MVGAGSRGERIYEPASDEDKGGRTDLVVINVSRLVRSFGGKPIWPVLRDLC